MLTLLIISIVVLVIGVILLHTESLDTLGFIATLVGVIAVIVIPLGWVINISSYNSNIQQYNAIKETIKIAREESISDIERAALTTKIIEVNEYLASAKYWNNTMFGDNIPDEFAELEYLK